MSKVEELLLNNGYDGVTYLENFDYEDALIGVTNDNRCVYDYDKMVEYLVSKQEFSEEETAEWISYNTIRALPYMGDGAPVVMYHLTG